MSENNITTNTQPEEEWHMPKNPWPATFASMLAMFIFVLDSTVANVALPHMAGSFSASNDESTWILTSYMIASGIVLPSVAWLSSLFGRKKLFIHCILIFSAASLLCGLARSMDEMILARIIQGLGGGAIIPISQAMLLENFPPEKRRLSMSVFGFGVIIAPIIGPVLGGWITDNYSWHWIFFINVPLGIIAAYLSHLFIEDPPFARKKPGQAIDFWGFFFLIVWLVCLQVVLDKGNNADWFGAVWVRWTFGASLFAMIAFIISQIVNKKSLIDISVFKDRNFSIGTLMIVIINGVMYSTIVIMPLFLQSLLRYTAFLSGVATIPRGIGSITAIIITAFLAKAISDKGLIALGLLIIGISSMLFGMLNLQISMMNILIPNLIIGFGVSTCMIPLSTISVVTLKNEQMTNAAGIQNLFRNIGGAIGTSCVTTMLSRFSQTHQIDMVGNLNNLNPAFQTRVATYTHALSQCMSPVAANLKANYLLYEQMIQQSTLFAYIDAFRIFGAICVLIIPMLLLFKNIDGDKTTTTR